MTYTNNSNTWQALASESTGYEQLERARDAAIDLIRGICSVSEEQDEENIYNTNPHLIEFSPRLPSKAEIARTLS